VECALRLHEWLRTLSAPIAAVEIRTHDEAINRICHDDYSDSEAANPAIDRLRALIHVVENPEYTAARHDLERAT
jgi:2-methylcitrate dehydratase PrpD